jgi:hypothetical protein
MVVNASKFNCIERSGHCCSNRSDQLNRR